MGGDDRQVVILLQVRADEVLEPCAIWQGASAGCMAIQARRRAPREGGSRCGCRRSHFRNRVSGTAGVV
jgi:hypothetical protein